MNAYTSDLPDLPGPADVEVAIGVAAKLEPVEAYAKHYAFRALTLAFPDLAQISAAQLIGAEYPKFFAHANASCETLIWWNDRILDRVLDAVANAPGQRK